MSKPHTDPLPSQSNVIVYFIAIFVPPFAVFLKTGCDSNFLINVLLTILGWVPGVIRTFLPNDTELWNEDLITYLYVG